MSTAIYRAKRVLRTPLIWYGRRTHANDPEDQRWRLEHNAYRRVALAAMGATAVDPHHYHRADLDADSVIIDIGAFRGHVAQELLDLYGCRIHAYEPNPQFYRELEERFATEPRVEPHPYGLGDQDATLTMQEMGLGSTVYGTDDGSVPTVEVQIRDIATVLDELGHERIDYLKINIEGAEYDLLDRLIDSGWIDRSRYLLIQFHEWYDGANIKRWRLRRKLRRTHEQVWNYPWIYELWCAKDQPHPPSPTYSKAELEQIRRELRAQREASTSGS